MDPIAAKLMSAAGAAADPVYVDDVFSTFVYEGTGAVRAINNGIDLSGEGGMVWVKTRNTDIRHGLFDTEQGTGKALLPNENWAQVTDNTELISFNSNGFTLGASTGYQFSNKSGNDHASWTFRKCPGFFDVVSWTGNGTSGRTISHNLGSVPGSIWVKRLSASDNWWVYHRSVGNTKYLYLNSNIAGYTGSEAWNNTTPTASVFTVGDDTAVNANGETYVAYIFAHDDQSFGDDGDEAIIKCGSYTGDGTTNGSNTVNLGFEPQWILTKRSDSVDNWHVCDVIRGQTTEGYTQRLRANTEAAESANSGAVPTSTGFKLYSDNSSGGTFIYIAIRRPNKPPSAATEVFNPDYWYGTNSSIAGYLGHPADFHLLHTGNTVNNTFARARLIGDGYLSTSKTLAQSSQSIGWWQNMLGFANPGITGTIDTTAINYTFRRAPGFFDVVAYAGDGVQGRNIAHNLGSVPEIMIVKRRDATSNWIVYHQTLGATKNIRLNSNIAEITSNQEWSNTAPTSSVFTVHDDGAVNISGGSYVAYLFATLSGISKIGSYSGTGNSIDVDCGFTAGARFVLIKRSDYGSTGDWYVWDSEQGIVSGNDAYVRLNVGGSYAVTGNDYIDPLNSGFTVTSSAPAALNASGGTYIFLAIA